MERVTHMVSHHAVSRVRDWGLCSRPGVARLVALVMIGANLAWAAALAPGLTFRAGDAALFAALLACGVATMELSRRSAAAGAPARDVRAVWELPVAIHLPLLYALVVPAVRLALAQWRARQAPPWREAFAAAAAGLAYVCASLVFHAVIPAGMTARKCLLTDAGLWLAAAGCCALAQWAVSQALALAAPRVTSAVAEPGMPAPRNHAIELATGVLVALAIQVSPLALIVVLPLGPLLQRSFQHAQLLADARADAKTGLLNAAAWEAQAATEVARAVRTGTPLAVAMLDLDHFKQVNDTYGHLAGDQVLQRIATAMTDVLRDYDLSGRFGGEEFVMLLPQTRAVDALRIAERVRAHVAAQAIYAGAAGAERVPVTVSIGVAALEAGSRRELTELLAACDAALYRAKASGRDQVQMISSSRGLSAVRAPAGGLFDPGHDATRAVAPNVPQLPGVGVGADRSSTATTSAVAVLHSDVTPFCSTCGVG
jgi:diguanylate cyclase (GGDEF)-like protein